MAADGGALHLAVCSRVVGVAMAAAHARPPDLAGLQEVGQHGGHNFVLYILPDEHDVFAMYSVHSNYLTQSKYQIYFVLLGT